MLVDAASDRNHPIFLQLMIDAASRFQNDGHSDWVASYEVEIHNLRVALDWASSQNDDVPLLVNLSVASMPLLLATGRLAEFSKHLAQ